MSLLLPVEAGAASSLDFTVSSGGKTALFLATTDGSMPATAKVFLEMKDSNGQYTRVLVLHGGTDVEINSRPRAVLIDTAGTYRVTRADTGDAIGVEQVAQ